MNKLFFLTKENTRPLNIILFLLSQIYAFCIYIREKFYKFNILKIYKLSKRVISIGNLTTGGTGKTPTVIKFAKILSKNKNIAILTRGYKRKTTRPIIITEENHTNFTYYDIGDEPYLIKSKLKNIIIGIHKKREKIAKKILAKHKVDIFILDDAYQYKKLKKDLNILLIDATNPFGNGYLLPRGILREDKSKINEADLIIITKSNFTDKNNLEKLKEELLIYNKTILCSKYLPQKFMNLDNGTEYPLEFIKNKSVDLVCGIANPLNFVSTVSNLEANIQKTFYFPDHYSYKQKDIKSIKELKKSDIILTTEKDAIKLKQYKDILKNIYVLTMDMKIENFDSFIADRT